MIYWDKFIVFAINDAVHMINETRQTVPSDFVENAFLIEKYFFEKSMQKKQSFSRIET